MNKYFGFNDRDDVAAQFEEGTGGRYSNNFVTREDFPTDEQILFAGYGGGGYDGTAHVLFEKDGKLFEVNGGHCSCYGLEDQWTPEETTWEAIAMRPELQSYNYDNDAIEAYRNLIAEHTKKE